MGRGPHVSQVLERICSRDSELGAHIDGYIATNAHTLVVLGNADSLREPIQGRVADCVCAAYYASELIQRLLRPGTTVSANIKREPLLSFRRAPPSLRLRSKLLKPFIASWWIRRLSRRCGDSWTALLKRFFCLDDAYIPSCSIDHSRFYEAERIVTIYDWC